MTTKKITVERVTFVSSRSFEEVLGLLDKGIGRPNLSEFGRRLNEASTFEEYASVIHGVVGSADLMEFLRRILGRRCERTLRLRATRLSGSLREIR
jgi:hypothetical protein